MGKGMIDLRWFAALCGLGFAGCLQASVDPPVNPSTEFQPAPVIAFQKDEGEDRLVMTAVGTGFEWDTLGLKADRIGTRVTPGGADDEPGIHVGTTEFYYPSTSREEILAGDFLDVCGVEGAVGPVTYHIAERETNTLVAEVMFDDVAACYA